MPQQPTRPALNLERLRDSMQWSAKQLKPFQKRNEEAIRAYAGDRYGEGKNVARTPVNLLQLAINIWTRQLVSQDPRFLITTRSPELKPDSVELELAVNHLITALHFGRTMQEVVRQAMFSIGILKVGITSPYLPSASGFRSQSGDVYADSVLFEDWLHDMTARRPEEWDWCGNRYRVPYAEVMENPNFDPRVKASISPEIEFGIGDATASRGSGEDGSTEDMSTDGGFGKSRYRKHVELWDIWIPDEQIIVTFPAQPGTEPLQVREWKGPRNGPYHLLTYTQVPGQVMPIAPAQTLYDLQDLTNKLFNQLARQATRQKTLTIVDGRGENDQIGERVRDASDGQIISASHIDSVSEWKTGGVDQGNFLFMQWVKEIFSYMGGNLDAMGGLARQANTLGQEKLLAETSSEMLRDMQASVVSFTQAVGHDIAWYMYTDPTMRVTLTKPVEGYGDIPFEYGPEQRTEDFFVYNFRLSPYSMVAKTPQDRVNTMLQIYERVILPAQAQMAEWGMTVDMKALMEILSKYMDSPEVLELISSEVPLEGQYTIFPGGKGGRALQSPTTTRNYTRSNMAAGPPGGAQAAIANAMTKLPQGGGSGAANGQP
jgi:hypothetical protein